MQKAIDSYERGLELDDARPEWETIRPLKDHEREAIIAKIAEVQALLGQS